VSRPTLHSVVVVLGVYPVDVIVCAGYRRRQPTSKSHSFFFRFKESVTIFETIAWCCFLVSSSTVVDDLNLISLHRFGRRRIT